MLHFTIFIALLLVAVVAPLTESLPTALDESGLVDECLTINNITQAEFQERIDMSSSEEELENLDRKYKCFAHCLATKSDILDSQGHVDVAKIDEKEPLTDDHRQALENCKRAHDEEADADVCEYAFNILLCISDHLEASDASESESDSESDAEAESSGNE
ncbi:general odorant-binding protein 57c [Drosophila obscura]|uniref:general odorant-binding protein 57c n=1 Tax=Drosophila obscura TaxID=7282 RepID=UPI001BB1D026|nr:general odorant-binding protein 57c [Drosophila obscura]